MLRQSAQSQRPGRAALCGAALAACLLFQSAATQAATVLFQNYGPDAPYSTGFGLNIWYQCTGRAIPFTVAEAGYVTEMEFPMQNWGQSGRGNLVVDLMLDSAAILPGFISTPNGNAIVEQVVHAVDDWDLTYERTFNVSFSGATLLEPGIIYWLGVSLDERVPEGVPGLTWWTNGVGHSGTTAARSGLPPDTNFWYQSQYGNTNALRVMGTAAVVPLPGTLGLLLTAIGALGIGRRASRAGGR